MNRLPLAIAALAAGLCAGCELEQPCDPGQIVWNEVCVDAPADASMPTAGGGSCIAADQAFGASCAAAADCDCGLDVCQTYGGPGYCTRTGCKQDPSVCPSGWRCADLSAYQPGLPSMCMRP